MFHIHWDQSELGAVHNAAMATFFDIYEDVSGRCPPVLHQYLSQEREIHFKLTHVEAFASTEGEISPVISTMASFLLVFSV